MELGTDDIIRIMKAAREHTIATLSVGGLSLSLGEILPVPKLVPDNQARRQEDLQSHAILAKIEQAEEMRLMDPVAYEELIEQSLVGERPPMPELNEPLEGSPV